jgi:uncharacterized membrane protein
MVALLLAVLIPSSAIAVDLGMQRVVRRDMQALADVVALDVARLVNGRTAAQIAAGSHGHPALETALGQSVARNDDVLGDAPVVTATLAEIDESTGHLDRNPDGTVREVLGSEIPNAIVVSATGGIDFAFAPGHGRAVRTSVAVPASAACFGLGSYAASFDSADAALLDPWMKRLLDSTAISSTAVGYQGLAASTVTLLDLVSVDGLTVGSVDELLALDGIRVNEFYAAVASVLTSNGGDVVAIDLLESMSVHANQTGTFAFADILAVDSVGPAALATEFNVLDLVVGAAYAVNGSNAIAVPSTTVLFPLLGAPVTVSLSVIEPPRRVCGRKGEARASTAQVDVDVSANLPAANVPLAGLLGQNVTLTGHVQADLSLARAEGLLTDIVCGDGATVQTADGIDVDVTSGLTSVDAHGGLRFDVNVNVVGLGRVTATLDLPLTATDHAGSANAVRVQFRSPPDQYGTAKSVGSSTVVSPLTVKSVSSLGATVTVDPLIGSDYSLPLNAGSLLVLRTALDAAASSTVSTLNNQFTDALNQALLAPLAEQLGVRIGGADVFALSRPSCDAPALAG